MPKPFTVWITTNCGQFLKRWKYQTTLPASQEIYAGQEATDRTGHGSTDGFHIGKGVISVAEAIDISPSNFDSSLCFFQPSVSHDVLCM